ncbi:MAG: peptide chain release factor-like protein [Candidatus Wildermuthbacteria bacterium]|nr:peptide chain release factor-like protein [Candidatus Wildermuthbacteria bacterium]
MKYATDRESLQKDSEVDYFRGSGPGGQRRNKVETGVRLRHASGIVVEAVNSRSQTQNKETAFARLKKRLDDLQKPKKRRKPTKVPARAKRVRLKEKRALSEKKQQRIRPAPEL